MNPVTKKKNRTNHDSTANRTNTKKDPSSEALLGEIYAHLVNERGICDIGGMTIGSVVTALREEGILFWRDARFPVSQKVAIELAAAGAGGGGGGEPSSYITPEEQKRIESTRLDCDAFIKFVSPHAIMFFKVFIVFVGKLVVLV